MQMAAIGAVSILAAITALSGCSDNATNTPSSNTATTASPIAPAAIPAAEPATAASFAVTDAWAGKWIGVEGLALTVAKSDAPGAYRLHVALMDSENDYVGHAEGDTIRFVRDGKPETIRHGTGADTGLKWLADKPNCLIIKQGEGFCRD